MSDQDIQALEHEINELKVKEKQLLEHINKLETTTTEPLETQFPELSKYIRVLESPKKKIALKNDVMDKLPKDLVEQEQIFNAKPLVEHKFFDDAIASLFDTELASPKKKKSRLEEPGTTGVDFLPSLLEQEEKQQQRREFLTNKIYLENIYRMFGITCFPVVDPSSLRYERNLDDEESDLVVTTTAEMLGVRMEVFNEVQRKFEVPHYIIFKLYPKNKVWVVFKHTLPAYIPIDELQAERLLYSDDLIFRFCKKVRSYLVSTSKKSQVMDEIQSKHPELTLESDVSIELVTMVFSSFRILLNLGLTDVESAYIDKEGNDTELRKMERILCGPVRGLESRLQRLLSII